MREEREVQDKTPLDEALETAKQDRSQANSFYDAFLNTDLFVPVQLEGTQGSWKKVGLRDRFQPLFVPSGDTRVVPAFDRLDRLREWATGRPVDYLELKSHILI